MTVFLRILEAPVDEKSQALLRALAGLRESGKQDEWFQRAVFERDSDALSAVPGSPFGYWVSETIRRVFTTNPNMTQGGGSTKCGLGTLDDFRFLRLWWESTAQRWVHFAKGGSFSRWYSEVPLVLDWQSEGLELKTFVEAKVGSASRKIQAQDFYFRAGLTWPRRTQGGFGIRALPAGCIFADKGPAVFIDGDLPDRLLALLAITSSAVFCYLVEIQMAFGSYEVGVIQRTPVPNLIDADIAALARLARRAWSLKRSLDTANETSHAFLLPLGPNEKVSGLNCSAVELELATIQKEVDETAVRLYGIDAEDRTTIEASAKRAASSDKSDGEAADLSDESGDSTEDEAPVAALADALRSWLVGVAFGRFDPGLADGKRVLPPEPGPFDPLPLRSPGMWPEGVEPAPRASILVDDEGHADDVEARTRAVADRVKVDVPENFRAWLAEDFFQLHIKMYSSSRRKAPIYWQIATLSASYSVWLYTHTFSKDTLFRVQHDYAAPKLAHEERRLESMMRELAGNSTAAERKELAVQETFVEELRVFLEEVKRVAPLWRPNLDDGIIINFAPLWRLVPQSRPWQKELKSTWDALCEGKYDWAHLAIHLWPERVVPKCAKDRSLAIAHSLEDVFWVEGTNGKWTARKTPTRSVDEVVFERAFTAVKAALNSLLEAPAASGGARQMTAKRKAL